MNVKHQPGDIIPLWYEWHCDMGDLVQYKYQGRWTAKSLIITVADKVRVPLAYHDSRYIVPRKRAQEALNKGGSVYVGGKIFWLEPNEVRNAKRVEAGRKHQEQQKAEADAKLAALTPYEWRQVRGLQKQSGEARLSPLMAKFVLDLMPPGERERFLENRTIDDPWEPSM